MNLLKPEAPVPPAESARYPVFTVADMKKIPKDKMDHFLKDLKSFLMDGDAMMDKTVNTLEASGINPKHLQLPEGFTWVDDGAHHTSYGVVHGDKRTTILHILEQKNDTQG